MAQLADDEKAVTGAEGENSSKIYTAFGKEDWFTWKEVIDMTDPQVKKVCQLFNYQKITGSFASWYRYHRQDTDEQGNLKYPKVDMKAFEGFASSHAMGHVFKQFVSKQQVIEKCESNEGNFGDEPKFVFSDAASEETLEESVKFNTHLLADQVRRLDLNEQNLTMIMVIHGADTKENLEKNFAVKPEILKQYYEKYPPPKQHNILEDFMKDMAARDEQQLLKPGLKKNELKKNENQPEFVNDKVDQADNKDSQDKKDAKDKKKDKKSKNQKHRGNNRKKKHKKKHQYSKQMHKKHNKKDKDDDGDMIDVD